MNKNNNSILLNNLLKSLFFPLNPPPSLVDSLLKYTLPVNTQIPPFDSILSKKSQSAFSFFKKLSNSPSNYKLVYVLLCISEYKNNNSIKFYALGIKTNEIKMEREIQSIYSQGLIYRQLKIEKENPISLIYKGFLEAVNKEIKEYEESILKAPTDFLGFYCETFEKVRKIKKIVEIGEFIKSRRYLTEGDVLLNKTNCLLPSEGAHINNNNINNNNIINKGLIYEKFKSVLFNFYNQMTHSYLTTSHFDDPFNEFFIKNHTLDYGLIPSFINNKTAETICYIGKFNSFLKSINKKQYLQNIKMIDLSKNSASTSLNFILRSLNELLYNDFFLKFKIFDLLSFINSTFLFGRIDFIEFLFNTMKDSTKNGKEAKKTGRKNICLILETALSKIFPDGPFNQLMDIYIAPDPTGDLNSSFSLFIKLEYPHTLLIEEEFVIKLVYIFKFLWKIKKIEYLTRRNTVEKPLYFIILKYRLLIQKMEFYVFNEVIGNSLFNKEFKWDGFAFDEFKKDLNDKLDEIITRLFINTKERKIEHFLHKLEKFLIGVFKNEDFDEKEVDKSYAELYSECNFIKKMTFY